MDLNNVFKPIDINGIAARDMHRFFLCILDREGVKVPKGMYHRVREMKVQYCEMPDLPADFYCAHSALPETEITYERKIADVIGIGSVFTMPHKMVVTSADRYYEQILKCVEFITDKIIPIIEQYHIVGSMSGLIMIDLATISLNREFMLGMYLALPEEDAKFLTNNCKWAVTAGGVSHKVTMEEVDKFMWDKQFNIDLENILTE